MGNPTTDPHAPPPAPILSLETILPVDFILIDGHRCELRQQAALSLFELRKFERLRDRMHTLQALEEPTRADEVELEALLADACRLVIEQPAVPTTEPDLIDRLLPQQRMRVVLAFLRLSRVGRVALAALGVELAANPDAAPDPASEELQTTST